jgi:hypothetical protein
MWWVQAAAALAVSRSPPRRSVLLARAAWRSPPRPPIESAEPGPEAAAARATSAAAGCTPATTTRAHVAGERHAAQEGGLVGVEQGGSAEASSSRRRARCVAPWREEEDGVRGCSTAGVMASSGSSTGIGVTLLASSVVFLQRHGVR